ncbi:unnamed protein product, partial [Effrenium voratum]
MDVLNVLRLLQRFGFLPNLSTFQELQGPLLRILDGRTDLLNLREVELQLDVRDVKPDHFGMGSGSLSDDAVVPLLRDEEVADPGMLTKEHFPPLIEAEAGSAG